jgi:fructosamine-3-kinase
MPTSNPLHAAWTQAAAKALGSDIVSLTPMSGGDFAQSYQALLQNKEVLFIKTHRKPPPNFFGTEAAGLRWLAETGTVSVPHVRAVSDDPPYLALQWIDFSGSAHASTGTTESQFGQALAALHRCSRAQFGRPDCRTTGSLALSNEPCDSWSEFYATRRLLPLAEIAQQRNALPQKTIHAVESLAQRLDQLDIPIESPTLLHGDLWAGNRLVDAQGHSWVIDPAAHHGHREFDLAMMQLFGGFDADCFAAYHEAFPLHAGWQQRVALHQLAPLIVHAVKFGGSYVPSVQKALRVWS